MKILLFTLLVAMVSHNCYHTYLAWTDEDYSPTVRWIITACGAGSTICFLVALGELIK